MAESYVRCDIEFGNTKPDYYNESRFRWVWKIRRINPDKYRGYEEILAKGSSRWRWKAVWTAKRVLRKLSNPASFIVDERSLEKRIKALEKELRIAA